MKTTVRIAILSLLLTALSITPLHAQNVRTIFLIRHADKISDAPDAILSEAGRRRAQCLARMLADTKIDQIFTSDLQRTQQTAAPLAAQRQIKPVIFPLADLQALIRVIESSNAAHLLVVWHGATLPAVLRALGGPEVPPIAEPEYDRFYVLTLGPGDSVADSGDKKPAALNFVALRYCDPQ